MKKQHLISFATLFLFLVVASLNYVEAAAVNPTPGGIVGKSLCEGYSDCDYAKFLELIGRVFKNLVWIALPLATLGIGISGVYIIFGGASESQRTRGKEIFWDSIIGFVIVLAAWLIIRTILIELGVPDNSPLLKLLGS